MCLNVNGVHFVLQNLLISLHLDFILMDRFPFVLSSKFTTALVVQIPMHVRGTWPAMPYTRLYSVHRYWWKRQVSHQR